MQMRLAVQLGLIMISTQLVALAQSAGSAATPVSAKPNPLPIQIKKTVLFIRTYCLHMPTGDELAKMSPADKSHWTDAYIDQLRRDQLAQLKTDSYLSTGFLLFFPDDRIVKSRGFMYLVTNRHVIAPGIEDGKPCKVLKYSIAMNYRGPNGSPVHLQELPGPEPQDWMVAEDDPSVDVAIVNARFPCLMSTSRRYPWTCL